MIQKFKNYKPTKKERQAIEDFRTGTGFDLMGADEVKGKITFKRCINRNAQWLRDWAEENAQALEKVG